MKRRRLPARLRLRDDHNIEARNPKAVLDDPMGDIVICMHCRHFACMKSIQIRNVPDQVCQTLKRRAAESGLSLQEYLLATMRELALRPSVTEVLRRAAGRSGGELSLSAAAKHLRTERDSR